MSLKTIETEGVPSSAKSGIAILSLQPDVRRRAMMDPTRSGFVWDNSLAQGGADQIERIVGGRWNLSSFDEARPGAEFDPIGPCDVHDANTERRFRMRFARLSGEREAYVMAGARTTVPPSVEDLLKTSVPYFVIRVGELNAALGNTATATATRNVITKVHGGWSVAYNGIVSVIGNYKGFAHIVVLIARPGESVTVEELAETVEAGTGRFQAVGIEMSDDQSMSDLRAKLAEVQDERESGGDSQELLEQEDWLQSELSRCSGRGGRTRCERSSGERRRNAVCGAIAYVLRVMKDRSLARLLEDAITLGYACRYCPTVDPNWMLEGI